MESLEQMGAVVPEIPRFDDGMVNLQELIRLMAESLVNEIMDAQADEACAEGNQRNGYRERALVTSVGPITLRIPKLRMGSYFPEDLLVRYSRVDRAVIAAVSEMVVNGEKVRNYLDGTLDNELHGEPIELRIRRIEGLESARYLYHVHQLLSSASRFANLFCAPLCNWDAYPSFGWIGVAIY